MKQIFQLTEHEISNATVKDYFSHEPKDFRWATVSLIDNALTVICGDCVGLPPAYLPNCPATSSEIKDQIAVAESKLQAAEDECARLQAIIAENEHLYFSQINTFKENNQDRVDWLKSDVKLWRKIAFSLLLVLALVVFALIAYIVVDLAGG